MPPIDISSIGLNYVAILPELVLTVFTLVVLTWDLFTDDKRTLAWVSAVGVLASLGAVVFAATDESVKMGTDYWGGMIVADQFGFFMKGVLLLVAFVVILLSIDYVEQKLRGMFVEFYEIVIFATLGLMLMVGSRDILQIYIGLELASISSYVLAGLLRKDARSNEAALKYFLNGSLASAVLLFGLSIIYGVSGTTYLPRIAEAMSHYVVQVESFTPMLAAGVIFMVAGFAFKVAAAPLHLWAPDTYEGAPTPVTGFFSVGPKGAAFAAMLRVFVIAFGAAPLLERWTMLFAILAAASMFIGNLTALMQTNIKRMMAYSSIAQAGYVLIGVVAAGGPASDRAISAVLYYVAGYAFTNLGIFTVLTHMDREGGWQDINDFKGLAKRNPVYAWLMLFFFASLIGIPPFVGFFGKLFLFQAALEGNLLWLAILMAVNSVISVGYYYGVVKAMFLDEATRPALTTNIPALSAVVLCFLGVLLAGIAAGPIVDYTMAAAGLK